MLLALPQSNPPQGQQSVTCHLGKLLSMSGFTSDAVTMELVDKLLMIDLVKRFTEIKLNDIGLLTCLHVLVKFLYKHDELRLTGLFSTETVL